MIIALQTLVYFRESLLNALDRLLRPYYKKFSLTFNNRGDVSDDEESDEHVFADFDDEKGVVFFPPVYAQRYAAVSDCLIDERWNGKLEKVVDLGYHDMSFIKYLKEVPGIKCIMGVDIERIPLRCSSDLLGCDDYGPKRESPLQVMLFQGNAADPDYRLIGCDAVVAIEMIEHMLPHDLDRLVHTVFAFIKPWIAIFTTPNSDFNVLFNSLEKNGLRRLDHFFEWSREQFHDWCSNIIVRYPEYTVNCKGIGPGPPGTQHHGCCSQLALFISKDYHKQQDLNLNSLALVANAPNPNNLSDVIEGWDNPESEIQDNNAIPFTNDESYTELLYSDQKSCLTIVLSPAYSMDDLQYHDKTSQCNLDSEVGRNFLMFDDEQMCFNVLVPRRKIDNKVYEIEDVASRLNCTTFQVKKFSKTTQNLMAKNKIDSLMHTREVVNEIRHLIKMLNFNKESMNKDQENDVHTWCNINWGENAPYWNQYYKLVREYNYPFEIKSDENRILDLVSDEINCLVDTQCDEEFSVDVSKLEIPIEHLMTVVQHITNDVDKVKDLLEWNGYEVVDNVVIHSRLVVGEGLVATQDDEWQDNDTFSDWDTTDIHSTSLSDGSTIVPDYHGRCLRRALDRKVCNLRSLLSVDEDITTELDRVVCRLMKLALRTCKGRQTPPPNKWIQYKLFDLLSLTEKAIKRRKRHFIDNYPLKAIDYDYQDDKSEEMLALNKIKEDNTGMNLVKKYRHLIQIPDDEFQRKKYCYVDQELEDDLSSISNEYMKAYSVHSPSLEQPESKLNATVYGTKKLIEKAKTQLARTKAWVNDDVEATPQFKHDAYFSIIRSADTNHSTSNDARFKCKKSHKRGRNNDPRPNKLREKSTNKSKTTFSSDKCNKSKEKEKIKIIKRNADKSKNKPSKTNVLKKIVHKKSNYNNVLNKNCTNKILTILPSKKKIKMIHNLKPTASKPIPERLIDFCQPKLNNGEEIKEFRYSSVSNNNIKQNDNTYTNIAATEESQLIAIITDNIEETIALRRTIGTDAEDPMVFENELFLGSLNNDLKEDIFYKKFQVATENVQSQTLFIYDINEPSTSKGIRHFSTDVQCGPDVTTPSYSTLSRTTSLTRTPEIFNRGIKIGDSLIDFKTKKQTSDFGTVTVETAEIFKTITPNNKSIGIKIKDSEPIIFEKIDCSMMTQGRSHELQLVGTGTKKTGLTFETKLLKPVSSRLKMEDSGSEFCGSVVSLPKSPLHVLNQSKNTSDYQIKTSVSKEIGIMNSTSKKCLRPQLSCGGVHVHSFKEKEVSEDVVYLGNWQRRSSKGRERKKVYKYIDPKKVIDPIIKRNKVDLKENILLNKEEHKKPNETKIAQKMPPLNMRNARFNKIKQNTTHKLLQNTNIVSSSLVRAIRSNKSITKVMAKKGVSINSSKNIKVLSKKPSISTTTIKKDNQHQKRKSYIPLYLKRMARESETTDKNNLNSSIDPSKKLYTDEIKTKTEKIKKDLLKFRKDSTDNRHYFVLCNEVKNANSSEDRRDKELIEKHSSPSRQLHSPPSQNSSTCSSPNSIATVRAANTILKTLSHKRRPTTSNRRSSGNIESDEVTSEKGKKFTKNCLGQKVDYENIDNKENIPESSMEYTNKDARTMKTTFSGKNKNIFVAQLATESTSLLKSKQQDNLNIRIPTVENFDAKILLSKSVSKETTNIDFHSENIDCSNTYNISPTSKEDNAVVVKIEDHKLLTKYIEDTNSGVVENYTSNTVVAIRQLLEESLGFTHTFKNDQVSSDNQIESIDSSPSSFNTVIANKTNSELRRNIHNRPRDTTLEDDSIVSSTDTTITITDMDMLSYKSHTSTSKDSGYVLTDSDLRLYKSHKLYPTSVHDIFERKDQNKIQNPGGLLAIQAFSGYSMNAEPVIGDQPEHINLIDSVAGSFAVELSRQVTSEEFFISGRSSESYEPGIIDDEDAVVPSWLFQIISQQRSIEAVEPQQLAVPIPVPESLLDPNGNVLETDVGVGAGAGDGRGMHSDHSQDSSGRGTSVSSTDTSSGPQSEAVLIDPTAFTAQFELLRESIHDPILSLAPPILMESPDTSFRTADEYGSNINSSHDDCTSRRFQCMTGASDVDADVSSLDTDVHDSSDN